MVVWVALVSGTVLFGIAALVVDAGYGMAEVRVMQNSADAGAMAAARLLAASVSKGPSGSTVYVTTDSAVHARALDLAAANRPAGLASATYQTAVQYVACPGQAAGTPNFTSQSDPSLAAQAGGTRLGATQANTTGIGASPAWNWPNPICGVRVHTRVSSSSLFAGALGQPTQASVAAATAQVFPTDPPKLFSGLWPITRWSYNAVECVFSLSAPCTFWSPTAPPGGSFKAVVDMSRYSQLALAAAPAIYRLQRLNCAFGGFTGSCWDQTVPGNNGKNVDVPSWVQNGWRGQLFVDEANAACSNPSQIVAQCRNSRLEMYGGDMGSNISSQMFNYINAYSDGIDPSCNCKGATIAVFFWRYGEQDVAVTCPSPPLTCVVDQGVVWGGSANPSGESADYLRQTGRIILEKARAFRFNTSTVSSSSVRGYYVSFYTNNPPLSGPPSTVANTVGLAG
jgi:hypothetical protein